MCGIYINMRAVLDPVSAAFRPLLTIVFCSASLITLQGNCLMSAAFSRHRGQVPLDASWWQPCGHSASAGHPGPLSQLFHPSSRCHCDQEPAFSPHIPGLACASKSQCSLRPTDIPCTPNLYHGCHFCSGSQPPRELGTNQKLGEVANGHEADLDHWRRPELENQFFPHDRPSAGSGVFTAT